MPSAHPPSIAVPGAMAIMVTSLKMGHRRQVCDIAAMELRCGLYLFDVVTSLQDGLADETDGKVGVKDYSQTGNFE